MHYRSFSSTSHLLDHYHTLDVPITATKAQIKTHFYKLSKKYHPDVAQDHATHGKFHAVSEAYAVLGDDRKRREYDRSLPKSHSPPQHPQATTTRPSHRPGSRNAWKNHHHPDTDNAHDTRPAYDHPWERARSGKYTYYQPPPGNHSRTSYTWSYSNPFSSPHVQRATGRMSPGTSPGKHPSTSRDAEMDKRQPRPEKTPTDEDVAAAESVLGRVFAVSGLLSLMLVIAQVAGAHWGTNTGHC